MANKSVPQLDAVTTLADSDLLHVVVSNVDKKITKANLAASILGTSTSPVVYSSTVTVNSAAILTSNTTPVLLIAAAGAGKAIVVLPSTTITGTFVKTPYATYTSLDIYTDTATDVQYVFSNFLNFSGTRTSFGSQQAATSAADTQIIANKGIYLMTRTGDPTAGDGTLTINLQYIIIDL